MIPEPLRIGLDPAVERWAPEARYVLGEILRIAGYPAVFRWARPGDGDDLDIYYGPRVTAVGAPVRIPADPIRGLGTVMEEPRALVDFAGLRLLDFDWGRAPGQSNGEVIFPVDIVRGAFWLLTGAWEPAYRRDRWDNLLLEGSVVGAEELYRRPVVSEYAHFLRERFRAVGRAPLDRPWCGTEDAAFLLTHDVDYPEIVRWIEVLRALGTGGTEGRRRASAVLRGRDQFWQFDAWVDFARSLGTRPTFYFMAARGSLARYALGTPDAFYDIRSPRFRDLFARLKEQECEIGLHASYRAYHDGARIASEKELLESTIGGMVLGGRHHYWHLNPDAPNDTLLAHERAGLQYDSSLAFEGYPGFRRGVCHPFMPFHPGERREIDVVQLPPTWMDDHFHRRRAMNGIQDPVAAARDLLAAVRRTNGVAVVDYHVRGMNGEFFPEYGPWLRDFMSGETSGLRFATAAEVSREYRSYVQELDRASRDETGQAPISIRHEVPEIEFGPMRQQDVKAVSRFHYDFFGVGDIHGRSLAKLGPEALEGIFYQPALYNPNLFVDVARRGDEIIAFSVYCTNQERVFRDSLWAHAGSMLWTGIKSVLRRPGAFMSLLGNVQYVGGEKLPEAVASVEGKAWYFLLGVLPRYRTREFIERTGIRIAQRLVQCMEDALRARGCPAWYGAVRDDNVPMNVFMQRCGGTVVASGPAQGQMMHYYLRMLEPAADSVRGVRVAS